MATIVKKTGNVSNVFDRETIKTKKGSFDKQSIEFLPDGEEYPLFLEASGDKLDELSLEDLAHVDVNVSFAIYSKMIDDGRVFNQLVIYDIEAVEEKKPARKPAPTREELHPPKGKARSRANSAGADVGDGDNVPF